MKCYRCSNVVRCSKLGAGIHPGMKYRLRAITGQGVRRGGITPKVSWTSDTCEGGVFGLVDLFRTTFVFGINSSGYFYSTEQFIGRTVRRGGGLTFGMLKGCGGGMASVSVIVVLY